MIDFTIQKEGLAHNIAKARENGILIPTIRQMQHPETIPEKVQAKLKKVGMGDVDPLNPVSYTHLTLPTTVIV